MIQLRKDYLYSPIKKFIISDIVTFFPIYGKIKQQIYNYFSKEEQTMKKTLTKALIDYSQSDYYPFHMPGHKRSHTLPFPNALSVDITEIDGFDNLHHPKGLIKTGMETASRLYHADYSYFLVNGSTCGILSSISAVTHPNDTILIARNSHKSAYHAAYLNQLHLHYLYPESIPNCEISGGISPEKLKKQLTASPEIKAVFLTSPTYEGVVSDISAIAKIVHNFHIPLIVDEAHGAHFGFCDAFPQSAITQGADIVIQSLHKTLPALTQTALLHQNGSLVSKARLEKFLSIYQTSSPSYLLMASIDTCLSILDAKGTKIMQDYAEKLENIQKELSICSPISLKILPKKKEYAISDIDPSKLLLFDKNKSISGKTLYQKLLQSYHLQCEMYMGSYVLALTSCMDTSEGFLKLLSAVKEMNLKSTQTTISSANKIPPLPQLQQFKLKTILSIAESEHYPTRSIPLTDGQNKISADFIYLYPPGIPLVVPGECFSDKILEQILWYQNHGFEVLGVQNQKINIINL